MAGPEESGPYLSVRSPVRPLSTELRTGIAASPGVAVGRAFVIDRHRIKIPKRHLPAEEVAGELVRLDEAVAKADLQLERLKRKLKETDVEQTGVIIEAYQLILHDEHLIHPTRRRIRDDKINAEWALFRSIEDIKQRFDAIDHEYFRERRSDVEFVGEQVLRSLEGSLSPDAPSLQPPAGSVVIAHDLSPADTVHLHKNSVAAIVTDAGGRTSHTSILAQALGIPAVVGLETITDAVGTGDLLIVDGARGEVILCPTVQLVEEYRFKVRTQQARLAALLSERDTPAITLDQHRTGMMANIELPDEVPLALDYGAEGIGLYRTEFMFLDRQELPREEEHFMHARGVIRRMAPFPATFRTFDLGVDKVAPFVSKLAPFHGTMQGAAVEPNPALGLRSLRLCLRDRTLFKTQLRGLLRASIHGRMRIMFPMVSGVRELREAKAILEECKADLRREGLPFAEEIPIGIMIEMPSAVMVAEHLAREVDFMSIGTNDLIQYTLAIDRLNEHVGYLYQPLHPAILHMVKKTVDAGHAAGKRVSMCGEMAGEPLYTLVLLGLKVDDLSMNPASLPIVKRILRKARLSDAIALADRVLTLPSAEEVEQAVHAHMQPFLAEVESGATAS